MTSERQSNLNVVQRAQHSNSKCSEIRARDAFSLLTATAARSEHATHSRYWCCCCGSALLLVEVEVEVLLLLLLLLLCPSKTRS